MARTGGKGGFITLEGGEGAGKSTQQRLLVQKLEQAGFEVIATREPGGSPKAEEIRALLLAGRIAPLGPFAEALMFSTARADHLDTVIRPALARGAFVVCDRFADSTRAYQGADGRVPLPAIMGLERIVVGATRPDLTLILDLPAETGLARATSRRGTTQPVDRFENETLSFHTQLRQAFLDIAHREPERCVVIDATAPAPDIAGAIWTIVAERLLPTLKDKTKKKV